jgi:hypothetical protein
MTGATNPSGGFFRFAGRRRAFLASQNLELRSYFRFTQKCSESSAEPALWLE